MPHATVISSFTLTESQFQRISVMVKDLCGINLHLGKKELVKARLSKRLRSLGLGNFDHYADLVRSDTSGVELTLMLDLISTNLTSFFRENEHFRYFAEHIVESAKSRPSNQLRVWSAGCSSGEEPYTVGIVLSENICDIQRWDIRILATDLSTRVLERAKRGLYAANRFDNMPAHIRSRYFTPVRSGDEKVFQVNNQLRSMAHFGRLNLMEPWPMNGPFDVIFCRNVMIYFDKPTQGKLIQRYFDILAPGGTLFIGHSESLTGIKHSFRYVQPTVYEKP